MLRFRKPDSRLDCLIDLYTHLQAQLDPLVGFPTYLMHYHRGGPPGGKAIWIEDDSICLRLPSPRDATDSIILRLAPEAAQDGSNRQIAYKFAALARYIASRGRSAWELRTLLVREEAFLWDNTILGLTHALKDKYAALEFLTAVRNAMMLRYEGRPIELSAIVTWNWTWLREALERAGCAIVELASGFELRRALNVEKQARLLSDGAKSLFVAHPNGRVAHLAVFPDRPEGKLRMDWEMVPPRYWHLSPILHGRDIVFCLNGKEEILVFRQQIVLKWSSSMWRRVSGPPLSEFLAGLLPRPAAVKLAALILRLSADREGALLVITDSATPANFAGSSGIASMVHPKGIPTIDKVSLEWLASLARIDGAMILDAGGRLRNAGVILEVAEEHTRRGIGARESAAFVASATGTAIKVSHDGPISIYQKARKIRELA